jgi:catechol 2,3-dioxygenase-like lactoylglutathione lyase family enzyme
MSMTGDLGRDPSGALSVKNADLKFEVVVIPVSDVGRAKEFYRRLGWRLDADLPNGNGFRVVQFTPPGSECSVQFGANITPATPGSARGLYLIVSDIEAARGELTARGAEVSEVFHAGTPGAQFQPDGASGRVSGPAPGHASYRTFATFSDPDGNSWLLQEVTERLPGRVWPTDVAALAGLLQETAEHHGSFEAVAPPHDWWDWYAAYMDARQRGSSPEAASAAAGRYMAEVKHVVV